MFKQNSVYTLRHSCGHNLHGIDQKQLSQPGWVRASPHGCQLKRRLGDMARGGDPVWFQGFRPSNLWLSGLSCILCWLDGLVAMPGCNAWRIVHWGRYHNRMPLANSTGTREGWDGKLCLPSRIGATLPGGRVCEVLGGCVASEFKGSQILPQKWDRLPFA